MAGEYYFRRDPLDLLELLLLLEDERLEEDRLELEEDRLELEDELLLDDGRLALDEDLDGLEYEDRLLLEEEVRREDL